VSRASIVAVVLLAACAGAGDDRSTEVTSGSPEPQRLSAGGVAPRAEARANPLQGDANAAEQGAVLFSSMNCDGCHGEGALGFVGPSLVDGRWRYGGDDGTVFESIFHGRPKGMPAYGGILSDTTIWQLVTYLRSRPVPEAVPTITWAN